MRCWPVTHGGKRTEVDSVWEEFKESTECRGELCCWNDDHSAMAPLGKHLCK